MPTEPMVFNGDHCVWHIVRQLADFGCVSKEGPFLGQNRPIAGQHHNSGFTLGNLEKPPLVKTEPNIGKANNGNSKGPKAKRYCNFEQSPLPTSARRFGISTARPF